MPGHRVSILSLHYPPDATGVAPYAGALAAGLSARGYRVTAYVAHPFYPEWKFAPGTGSGRAPKPSMASPFIDTALRAKASARPTQAPIGA